MGKGDGGGHEGTLEEESMKDTAGAQTGKGMKSRNDKECNRRMSVYSWMEGTRDMAGTLLACTA